jgi:glycosyltransferase involved in cell wall biosynthesis
VTEVLKRIIVRAGVPEGRVSITPNGIVPEHFDRVPARADRREPVVLGFVGFMRDWHGLDRVIAALAEHQGPPVVRFDIVGDGPARSALERQVAELGIGDRVRFAGLADRASIPDLIGGFDIALQPQVVSYASPLKLFEYMAAGRAIVAPDLPNIREILCDGVNALLFDPAEDDSMWKAIVRLLTDAGLRDRLGRAARATVRERDFTWAGNARRISEWAMADIGVKGELA